MKNIKPIYIYGIGVILSALVFIFLSQNDETNATRDAIGSVNRQMPHDNIHNGLTNPAQLPNQSNVSKDVMQHMQMLKQAAESDPRDTAKLKAYADFLSAAHQSDEALVYYNKILSMYPKRIDVLFSVAYLNYIKRNFAEAEKDLKKVISYDRNNLQAYYNLGAIAASEGDKEKAKEIWNNLIKEHPTAQIAATAKKSLSEI